MDTAQTQNIYLPWPWRIEPVASSAHKCPSRASVLLTYLAVNCLIALLGVGLSHRTVINKLSCGWLGRDRSKSWMWIWIVQLGLHFGADFIVAYITTHAPGYNYETSPKTWDLALFYASRPRMAWILLSFLGTYKLQMRKSDAAPTPTAERTRPAHGTRRADTGLPAQGRAQSVESSVDNVDSEGGDKFEMVTQAPVIHENSGDPEPNTQIQEAESAGNAEDAERLAGVQAVESLEGYWTSAARQTLIVEAIMQVVGSYYLGRTAHFATTHGYYLPNRHYDSNARLMYGGALFTLVVTYMSMIGIYGELAQLVTRDPTGSKEFTNYAFSFGYVAYTGSWLFWSGYVKLARDGYVCPTQLNTFRNSEEVLR
jgi:hypothetical protein